MSDLTAKERVAHTPGPWTAHGYANPSVHAEASGHIATIRTRAGVSLYSPKPRNFQQAMADARLIAAAPDLLEWAEKVLATYMPHFTDSRAVDDALVGLAAAVAKATDQDFK